MTTKIKLSIKQIIELKQKGISQKEIANIFEVTQQTIIRWKKQKKPAPERKKRKPKDYGNIPKLLKSYISTNNTATQQEMANYIYKETSQRISQQKVSRILGKHEITYKTLTYHYCEQNLAKVKQFIKETKPLLLKYPFLAIDECGFHLNEDPRQGYSIKGTRAVSKRPSSKGEHYTLLLCIKNVKRGGVVCSWLIEKGADWKIFYDFLESIKLTSSKRHFLLMDNASIHRAPKKRKDNKFPNVKEQLAKKNIEIRNIVSYSPQLNPTELCFNFLRQNIEKNRPRNFEDLKNYIVEALKVLNKQDLTKYFKHCFDYFSNNKVKNIKKKVTNAKRKQNGLLPRKRKSIK